MAATILIVSGKFLSMKNDGTPNNGGLVFFWQPGTSTPLTTYSNSALSIANAHPVVLDAAGRGIIYFSGNADITVRDSASALLYTQTNVNPQTTANTVHITTPTTLDATHNGKWITTTVGVTLPTAISAGSGWWINLKNLASTSIVVSRGTSGDTLNNVLSGLTLPPKQSVNIIVNNGVTGFDIFFNPLLEIGSGISGQVLGYDALGPVWQTVDLRSVGNKLYLFNNFT